MGIRSTRFSALAVVGALAFGVVACGGDDNGSDQGGAPAQKTEPLAASTAVHAWSSASNRSMAASMPLATSPFTALRASGRFSVMRATRPWTS